MKRVTGHTIINIGISIKGTVMQIEKALMIASVFQKYPENFAFQLFTILQQFTSEICYFLKK